MVAVGRSRCPSCCCRDKAKRYFIWSLEENCVINNATLHPPLFFFPLPHLLSAHCVLGFLLLEAANKR